MLQQLPVEDTGAAECASPTRSAAISFTCRKAPQEEDDLLKQSLLQPVDPEAGEKKSRSWPSLLLTAIVYVWPDTPGLRLRAILCIVIIAAMRLLNLAVPILYKHVVDTMANVSARTHPTGPEPPQTFNFMQVCSLAQCLDQSIVLSGVLCPAVTSQINALRTRHLCPMTLPFTAMPCLVPARQS